MGHALSQDVEAKETAMKNWEEKRENKGFMWNCVTLKERQFHTIPAVQNSGPEVFFQVKILIAESSIFDAVLFI